MRKITGFTTTDKNGKTEEYIIYKIGNGTIFHSKNITNKHTLFHGHEFGRFLDNTEDISRERLLGALDFALEVGLIKNVKIKYEYEFNNKVITSLKRHLMELQSQ